MSKGPHITEEVRLRIATIAIQHPKWNADTVRHQLLRDLEAYEGTYERDWPSKRTVQSVMREQRPNRQTAIVDELDRPWSLVAVAKYEIPPDVLPVILDEWARRLTFGHALTIRQVRWMARLSGVLTDPQVLSFHACVYASIEASVLYTGQYPASQAVFERLLWPRDIATYSVKEPHDSDVERLLRDKYLQKHWSGEGEAGGHVFAFSLTNEVFESSEDGDKNTRANPGE